MAGSKSPAKRSGIRGAVTRRLLVGGGVVAVIAAVWAQGTACSPTYVLRAGWEEAKILRARQPIAEVILAPDTDERTRGKLTLAREARRFAIDSLRLDAGDSYTTYVRLERDTLALVLSAAYPDRLASKTWWFPVVGHVPYRGFFDLENAAAEQRALEEEGWDTYLRPTAAFSTLGWFSDPLLSTVVRYDEVELVSTILHELSHNHLFVPGRVRFNESYATWVGRAGAARFFCGRAGGGGDTVWCNRARDRWHDVQAFSGFLDGMVGELEVVYGDTAATTEEKVARRSTIFERHRQRFLDDVRPSLGSLTFRGFLSMEWNNATLLSRMRYYHRLRDFGRHQARSGTLAQAIEALRSGIDTVDDPFELLSPDTDRSALEARPRASQPGYMARNP